MSRIESRYAPDAPALFGENRKSAGRSLIERPGRAGDSRFSCMLFLSVRGSQLRRTEQPLANNVGVVLPSSYSERSRHPDPSAFRPTSTSGLRFKKDLAMSCKTRGQEGFASLQSWWEKYWVSRTGKTKVLINVD